MSQKAVGLSHGFRLLRFVEFKEYLYSSPMTTPRDTTEGKSILYPGWNNSAFVSPLTSYPFLRRCNRGSVSVIRASKRERRGHALV